MELEGCACPIYMNAWCNMISSKNSVKTDIEKLKIITEFAEKYTMLPSNWLSFLQLSWKCGTRILDNYIFLYSTKYSNSTTAKHLEWPYPVHIIHQLGNRFPKRHFQAAEDALKFPHKWVNKIYLKYSFYTTKPLSKTVEANSKKYQKLYTKMKECENDIDEWLLCLKEIEDKESVIANFELKLGQGGNWTNKNIWDAYFKFLKENNRKEILDVYRKYTRLFISDKEAIEDYRNEIEKFSSRNIPTTKYWIDTIKYEMDFGDLKFAYQLLKNAVKAILGQNVVEITVIGKMVLIEEIKIWGLHMENTEKFRFKNIEINESLEEDETVFIPAVYYTLPKKPQYFCFRRSFIQNLLQTKNGNILRKLYATCKFFYAFHKARLCYRLDITKRTDSRYYGEAICYNEVSTHLLSVKNLHIYGFLHCYNTLNRKILSQILQKINWCNVQHLMIKDQDLTFGEFKFLLSNDLLQIHLIYVGIYEAEKEVEGMEVFNFSKNTTKIKFFEHWNKKNYIDVSFDPDYQRSTLTSQQVADNHCEIIYIDGQELKIEHLISLLEAENLKSVTLRNTVVKDEDDVMMTKNDIEDVIKLFVTTDVAVKVD